MYKYIFLFILFIFLGGCGKAPPPKIDAITQITLPKWYTTPKLDNKAHMYSTGSGTNKNEAVLDALNNFASKLGTTIESTYQSTVHTNSINGLIDENTKNNIKAYISKLRVSDYELLSVIRISYNETLVELQIDKVKFVKTLNRHLTQQIDNYKQKLKFIDSKNILVRYLELELLVKNSKKIISNTMILKQLDSSFKYIRILSFVNSIEKRYNEVTNKMTFFVKPDKNSKEFASIIKNFISNKKLKLANISTNNSINMHINATTRISKISGSIQIAIFTISLTTYIDGKQVGNNRYILKERFNGSYASSLKNAVLHFKEEIYIKKVMNLLNI